MYGNEYEDFSSMLDGSEAEMLGTILGIVLVGVLIGLIIGLVLYVLRSLGMYTIAKRRGISNPWLAWLPIGNQWIAGSIADQYHYAAKGQVTNRRIIMLVLAIAGMVVGWFSGGMSLGSLGQMVEAVSMGDYEAVMAATSASAGSGLVSLLSNGVSIAATVFWLMSMYDLYSSCCPQHNVLFVILGFFFFFLEPFFIFCNRNKDEGMPMSAAEPEQPVWQAPQPVQTDYQYNRVEGDPWDNNTEN